VPQLLSQASEMSVQAQVVENQKRPGKRISVLESRRTLVRAEGLRHGSRLFPRGDHGWVHLARTPGQAGSASYQYEHTTIFLIEYAKLISVQSTTSTARTSSASSGRLPTFSTTFSCNWIVWASGDRCSSGLSPDKPAPPPERQDVQSGLVHRCDGLDRSCRVPAAGYPKSMEAVELLFTRTSYLSGQFAASNLPAKIASKMNERGGQSADSKFRTRVV
jgi:hypothetical protein